MIRKNVCLFIMFINVMLLPFFFLVVAILWGEAMLLISGFSIVKALTPTMLLINPYLYRFVGIWTMSNFAIYFCVKEDLSEESRKGYELFNTLLYVFIPIVVCYLECSLK